MSDIKNLIIPEKTGFDPVDSRRPTFDRANSVIVENKTPVAVCFIGDSITESFEVNAYFHEFGILLNRGIGYDKVEYIKQRLTADLIQLKPRVGVLLAGYNNFGALWQKCYVTCDLTDKDQDDFVGYMTGEYTGIFDICGAAGQKMIVCSIMPVGVDDFRNPLIARINSVIKGLCENYDFDYADYYSALINGAVLKDVTFGDLLHPHVKGYDIMAEVLRPLLKKNLNG